MRKLLSFNVTSVSSYYEGSGQPFDWPVVDEEFNRFALQQLEEADMLLFGRAAWPRSPSNGTLDAAEWARTQLIGEMSPRRLPSSSSSPARTW